jgi:hypothetical protein
MLANRAELERRFVQLHTRTIAREQQARQRRPQPKDWAFSFAGNPRGFFRELIGEDWDTHDWMAWRAFISAVFVQPLTAGEWHIYRRCTQLQELPQTRPTSVWLPIGRRGGKSRILAAIAVYLACCYDWTHNLDPGELGVIPVLAADRRQARTLMSYVKAFIAHPRLQPLVKSEQAESVLLEGQVLIEVVTASYRAVRSRTVLAALCDEIAFWRSEEESANPDREVINALEPAMATIPNALLLGASSPYSRRGVLWDMYERWYGKPGGAFVWKAATRTMNPTVTQSFIDEQYAEDPVSAAAEYGAEFRSDVDAFLSRDALDDATMQDVHEISALYNTRYHAFCDPSGGNSDSMTLAIGHVDRDGKRAVLDVLRERRAPFSPEAVVEEFVTILRDYKVGRVKGDHYAGEWPADRFKRCGIQYDVMKKVKSDIYLEFLPLINAGRCALLDDRRMYTQFLNLERRVSRGGKENIDHPKGMHDDLANVVAGVMVDLLGKRDPTLIDARVLDMSAKLVRPHGMLLGAGPRWG